MKIIRKIAALINGLSKPIRLVIKLGLPIILVALGFFFMKSFFFDFGGRKVTIGEVTISDISPSKKLKVLTIFKEILVSQYRDNSEEGLMGFMSSANDEISTIYPARIDLGFDLSKCDQQWIVNNGDSVVVNLPSIEILNKDGKSIDEANKRVPIETGTWSSSEKEDFSQRAEALMHLSCQTDGFYKQAEESGARLVRDMLGSLTGNKNLSINIKPSELPYTCSPAPSLNPFTFHKDGLNTYLVYENGAKMDYKIDGIGYNALLLTANYFANINGTYKKASLFSSQSKVIFAVQFPTLDSSVPDINDKLQKESNSANTRAIVDELNRIFPESEANLVIMDKNGKILSSIRTN